MKKFLKALTAVLAVVVLAVALVGCSDKYGKIKKAYEDAGYTISEVVASEKESQLKDTLGEEQYNKIKDSKILFCNKSLVNLAFVVTFGSTDELKDFYGDEDAYNKAVESGYVNGNCVLLLGLTQGDRDIFKNA